ncbi:MAG: serine/threonine protein kinase [Ardenticatenaceae bacterium]
MDRIGDKLGNKYELVEHLGQGGMAEVYKALQSGVERFVAVKILHRHLSSDADFLERFRREAKAMGQLQHRNIVGVIECDTEANEPYIVLQYVPGGTVREYIKEKGTLPPIEALHITAQVANALAEAHQKGLIHRDIKPANIMFMDERKNDVVLSDFGLARLVDSKTLTNLTTTGAIPGTIPYMAREVIQSENADQRSDIYSLGVVLYEMLTGSTPYSADSAYGIMVKQIKDESFPRPSQKNPNVPQELDGLVLKALHKDPDQRFQSAEEFFHAIEEMLAVLDPSQSRPRPPVSGANKNKLRPSPPPDKPFWVPKMWRPLVAVAGGVLLAALVTVTLLMLISTPGTATSSTETPIPAVEQTDPLATTPNQTPILTGGATDPVEPTQAPNAPQPSAESVGVLRFTDNGGGQVSGVTLEIDQAVLPPQGQNYDLWLVDSRDPNNNKFHLGAIEKGPTNYNAPGYSLARYDEVRITLGPDPEQILFSGRLDAEFLDQLRAMIGAENGKALFAKAVEQRRILKEQLESFEKSVEMNDLAQAKRHTEAIVNILQGEEGLLTYFDAIKTQTKRVLKAQKVTPELESNANEVIRSTEKGWEAANKAVGFGLELLKPQELDNSEDLTNDIKWYVKELVGASTISPNPEIGWILHAHQHALQMADIKIYPVKP